MRVSMRVAMILVLLAGLTSSAGAQTASDEPARSNFRVFVSVNGGYQVTSTDFQDGLAITRFAEEGQIDTRYTVDPGPVFDGSAAVRLWRSLGVSVAVTRFEKTGTAEAGASIPHPLFFNQPRLVSGQAGGIKRQEIAVHTHAIVFVPAGPRLLVALFGGPTFFDLRQTLVSDVEVVETYPFDTAEFSTAVSRTESESKVGFGAGADVTFLFSRYVGAGGLIRFSRATVELGSADGDTVEVDVGGLEVGGGIRFLF